MKSQYQYGTTSGPVLDIAYRNYISKCPGISENMATILAHGAVEYKLFKNTFVAFIMKHPVGLVHLVLSHKLDCMVEFALGW